MLPDSKNGVDIMLSKHADPVQNFLKTINEIKNYIGLIAPNYLKAYEEDEHDSLDIRNVIVDVLTGGYAQELATNIEQDYDIKIVETHGGSEGDGETHWHIFKYHNEFFRLPGFYSSYQNTEYFWDEVRQVVGRPKSIIEYVDI